MRDGVVFTEILVGLEQTSASIELLISRLAAPRSPRPLIFETWADDAGVRHFVGRLGHDARALEHLIRSHLPECVLRTVRRPDRVDQVRRVTVRGGSLPPTADTSQLLHALHAAFNSRRRGESVVIQLVFGRGHGPEQVPRELSEPSQTTLKLLLDGKQRASTETRRRLVAHRALPRIDLTVRIGVGAPTSYRQRALFDVLANALSLLDAPGTRIVLARDNPVKWQRSAPGWAPLRLGPRELAALLAWPADHLQLPGLPPTHPRSLAPPVGLSDADGVFAVATKPGFERPVGMTPAARAQHLVVTGGTGSGKSMLLGRLCLEDIAAGRPTLLVDPKRQLVDFVIDRVSPEVVDRIVLIDASEAKPVGVNPLDVGDRDPDVVVDGILSVFKSVFEDGWGPRTEDLLHAALLSLARDGARRGRPHTLLDLPRLLSESAYRRSVTAAVADDPTLHSFWSVFDDLSPAHRAAIIAPPMNKLRKYLLRKNIAAVLGQERPRFRMRDLFRESKTVLVPLNDALLGPGSAQLLGGLIVAEAWLATMERANEQEPLSRPGMIFIDEVQRFVHLPTSVEDALATSRSYGVAWHVALQGRSQVSASFALALELNARNKVTFAASPHDAAALARSTKALSAEDFQSLGRYEIYADLVVNGSPAGWFSAATLPPPPPLGSAEHVRAASRRLSAEVAPSIATYDHPGDVEAEAPIGLQPRRRP